MIACSESGLEDKVRTRFVHWGRLRRTVGRLSACNHAINSVLNMPGEMLYFDSLSATKKSVLQCIFQLSQVMRPGIHLQNRSRFLLDLDRPWTKSVDKTIQFAKPSTERG